MSKLIERKTHRKMQGSEEYVNQYEEMCKINKKKYVKLIERYMKFVLLIFVLVSCWSYLNDKNHTRALSLYRNSTQLDSFVQKLVQKHSLTEVRCQSDPWYKYVTFGNPQAKLTAVITCNVHARELLTAELCVEYLDRILSERNISILNDFSFKMFYNANKARDSIFAGHYDIRTDENDVDLNRNYPSGFNHSAKIGQETYGGPFPLSENFTQCLDQLVNTQRPTVYLDIHTGQFTLFYATGNQPQPTLIQLLTDLQQNYCKACRLKQQKVYDLNGGSNQQFNSEAFCDFKYRYQIKYSTLFEIYGGYKAQESELNRCFTIFNPETKLSEQFYLQKWINILNQYFMGISSLENPAQK